MPVQRWNLPCLCLRNIWRSWLCKLWYKFWCHKWCSRVFHVCSMFLNISNRSSINPSGINAAHAWVSYLFTYMSKTFISYKLVISYKTPSLCLPTHCRYDIYLMPWPFKFPLSTFSSNFTAISLTYVSITTSKWTQSNF